MSQLVTASFLSAFILQFNTDISESVVVFDIHTKTLFLVHEKITRTRNGAFVCVIVPAHLHKETSRRGDRGHVQHRELPMQPRCFVIISIAFLSIKKP
jgi:hypothetical protein